MNISLNCTPVCSCTFKTRPPVKNSLTRPGGPGGPGSPGLPYVKQIEIKVNKTVLSFNRNGQKEDNGVIVCYLFRIVSYSTSDYI